MYSSGRRSLPTVPATRLLTTCAASHSAGHCFTSRFVSVIHVAVGIGLHWRTLTALPIALLHCIAIYPVGCLKTRWVLKERVVLKRRCAKRNTVWIENHDRLGNTVGLETRNMYLSRRRNFLCNKSLLQKNIFCKNMHFFVEIFFFLWELAPPPNPGFGPGPPWTGPSLAGRLSDCQWAEIAWLKDYSAKKSENGIENRKKEKKITA